MSQKVTECNYCKIELIRFFGRRNFKPERTIRIKIKGRGKRNKDQYLPSSDSNN